MIGKDINSIMDNKSALNSSKKIRDQLNNGSFYPAEICGPGGPNYQHTRFSPDNFLLRPIQPAAPYSGGIETYLDPKYASDPAAFASRLPYMSFPNAYGMYEYGFEPAFIRKRNERERQRVKCVNEGYARLREHLPEEFAERRLSKVSSNFSNNWRRCSHSSLFDSLSDFRTHIAHTSDKIETNRMLSIFNWHAFLTC